MTLACTQVASQGDKKKEMRATFASAFRALWSSLHRSILCASRIPVDVDSGSVPVMSKSWHQSDEVLVKLEAKGESLASPPSESLIPMCLSTSLFEMRGLSLDFMDQWNGSSGI